MFPVLPITRLPFLLRSAGACITAPCPVRVRALMRSCRFLSVLLYLLYRRFLCRKKENVDKIQEIFTAPWAIADNDYYRLLSLLVPCVAAGNLDAIEKRLDNNKITAYATTPYLANRWELDDETLPADSVAVIILEGTLYSWETYRLEKQLRDVFDNPKICGAVLWINGPGGMVAHVDLAAKMIAESSKPIATYVAGTMGSAHFWLGTAAGRTFIASPMCEVGSVGIMLTYQSFKEYFRKQGIDYREIYPDSADLKNYETRAIEKENNEEPIKQRLAVMHRIFCDAISRNLGIAYDPELPLSGDRYSPAT